MGAPIADAILKVPTKRSTNFFRLWVEFLGPYHNLTEREIDVLTCFLKIRHNLSKSVLDEKILDKVLFSDDSKKSVCDEIGITEKNFNMVFSRLKKKNLIINNSINKRFIPLLKDNAKVFQMLVYFEFSDD
jgi:hypothetical protein